MAHTWAPHTVGLENISTSIITTGGSVSNSFSTDHTHPCAPADSPPTLVSINALPNELLVHIFEYLDYPQPSIATLYDEPHFELTKSHDASLKAISRVSKRWRQASIPILFKHAQFAAKKYKTNQATLIKLIQPFFDFIRNHSLHKVVASFTLLIHDKKASDALDGFPPLNGFSVFWEALFNVIEPLDLLIVAPAQALGALTACRVYIKDALNFDCPCHYLRLQRSQLESRSGLKTAEPRSNITSKENAHSFHLSPSALDTAERAPRQPLIAVSSTLFSAYPWSSLLLNEGSFIRAYAMYEFWLRQAPSIMPNLVGGDKSKALISPTIRDMSYIGIFPMSNHFRNFAENCPRLDRLYVQLVPRNDIMENPSKMVQVEKEDLWMERNACYAALMRQLFNAPPLDNYKLLKVFESGDAADREAWLMAVEYVKRAASGWKVVGDGVFERDPEALVTRTEDGQEEAEGSALSVSSTAS